MRTATASLFIQVFVECPHCEESIDLMDEATTNGTNHNEEGQVIIQACPDNQWHEEHPKFSVENVTCSECKNTFNVKELEW
tara:strand:- start:149 stop:391 length:243 start_codon:yes stop_codon:yes gene_type:complete